MENNILNIHTSSDKNSFTIYSCGKFNETKKVLTKAEAALLYIELHKWLFNDKEI